jgi:hypothetical protein
VNFLKINNCGKLEKLHRSEKPPLTFPNLCSVITSNAKLFDTIHDILGQKSGFLINKLLKTGETFQI